MKNYFLPDIYFYVSVHLYYFPQYKYINDPNGQMRVDKTESLYVVFFNKKKESSVFNLAVKANYTGCTKIMQVLPNRFASCPSCFTANRKMASMARAASGLERIVALISANTRSLISTGGPASGSA